MDKAMSLDDGYVTAEYLKDIAEKMRTIKHLSYEHMAIRDGDKLLDVGCGPGVDTLPLAELCGINGKVIGIDNNEAMLAEANQSAQASPYHTRIEHRQGSALQLPLADNTVDATRAERLIQVLPPENEKAVVDELYRVTRPNGRVVLVDTDWGSATIDFSDPRLERRLMHFFTLEMRPNGLAGRRLYALCREKQLEDIRVDVVPMIQRRLGDTPFGDWLIDTALSEKLISNDEAARWQGEMQEREQQQCFSACVNMVIVSGRKPDNAK